MTDEEKEEYAEWLEIVKKNGREIEDVPERFKTVELCAEAVKNFTYLLDEWEVELKDLDYYLNDYYFKLREPEEYKQIVKAAKEKKEDKGAFKYVPEEIKDAVHLELYEQYKLHSPEDYFPDLPEHLKTAEMCWEEVKRDGGYKLEYVPEKFKTLELCIEATKNSANYSAFEYVPEHLKKEVTRIVFGI